MAVVCGIRGAVGLCRAVQIERRGVAVTARAGVQLLWFTL